MCLWHDVKLRKTQLEVRSLNVTWRRDLWCNRVIVFFRNVSNCWLNSYGKLGGVRAAVFSLVAKNLRGVDIRPPAVRGIRNASCALNFRRILNHDYFGI